MVENSDIIAKGADVIRHQAKVLETTAEKLGQSFEDCVTAILQIETSGRLLITGMGKAACIAQKISTTFASLGVASFFVAPSDAIHGDLGRFTSNDLILILSNSGETNEIIEIMPILKHSGCKMVSITREQTSTLGRQSDICLQLGKIEECWPLHLAPTASSTAMLAIGDALAMVVTWKRGFTREDYGRLHPGGDIGRSFKLVSEIMRSGERNCLVKPQTPTGEAIHLYTKTAGRPGCATIIDENNKLIGIFTDGNLRRLLDTKIDFLNLPIGDNMTPNPKWIYKHAYAREALELLTDYSIDQLVVLDDDDTVAGMVDIQDVAALFSSNPFRLKK